MTPEVKEKIKDKTTEEIRLMVKSGEIKAPTDKDGMQEFLKYSSMKPEDREPAEPKVVPDVPPAEPISETPDKGSEESVADDTEVPLWKDLGYASGTELKDAHKKLFDLNAQLQSNIDNINAREGKRGEELKSLKEERKRLVEEIAQLKKQSTPEIKKPEKPVVPKASDYADGRLDDKYIEAMDAYGEASARYVEDLIAYERAENQRRIDELTLKVEKPVEEPAKPEDSDLFNQFWNVDIPNFQKKFGITASVSMKQISDAGNGRNQAFLNTLPKSDLEAYEKIKDLCLKAYDFTDKGPVPKYAKKLEGAAHDYDLLGEGKPFNIVKPTSLTVEEEKALRDKKQRENESVIDTIPAARLAGSDESISKVMTDADKVKRYRDLLTDFKVAQRSGDRTVKAFQESPAFDEFKKLGVELGYQKPGMFDRK